MNKKIAVIAGTPVDTQMGVDYLNKKDPKIQTIYLPLEDNPRACHVFQMKTDEEKHAQMKAHFEKGLEMGAEAFFIHNFLYNLSFCKDCLALHRSHIFRAIQNYSVNKCLLLFIHFYCPSLFI